jgi:hypothetical protein
MILMLQIRGIMAKSFGDRFFFFPSDELLHFEFLMDSFV